MQKDIYMPRLPSLKTAHEIGQKPVNILSLDDFPDTDETHYGLSGSATQVERIFPPENNVTREVISGPDSAQKLIERLKSRKFL